MLVLPVKVLDIRSTEPVAMISHKTASNLKFRHTMIINIKNEFTDKSFTATPVVAEGMIEDGVIGISQYDSEWLNIKDGENVVVSIRRSPVSLDYIKTKMGGNTWSQNEIYAITNDISRRAYTSLEIASFALTSQFQGYSSQETADFAKAMAECGNQFDFQEKAFDKHSIGGIPGNKVSLLIVPIVAAAGLLIPKTSSRAITSPSGTADSMEVLADVTFSPEEMTEIAPKTRGMIVWNAPLKLSPMDDIVIGVKKFLDIDPQEQMMASIVSTKIAMGIDNMVIDVPTGAGSKMENQQVALDFAHKFIGLSRRVGIDTEGMLTLGSHPLGRNIGPALEAKEAIEILEGKVNESVLNKSAELAGTLLEMGGLASPSNGARVAKEVVKSGKALSKMQEIIEAQGGEKSIKSSEIQIGSYSHTIKSARNGYVYAIKNLVTKKVCAAAGTPSTKRAGMIIHVRLGDFVKKGDALITIYSDSETKLSSAIQIATNNTPVVVEGMVLRRVKLEG